jgi:L-rhamnonate dehydratase
MTRIESINVVRIPAPQWRVPQWWATCPMDALYDQRERFRAQQIGLFNASSDTFAAQPVLLAVQVTASNGQQGLGCITLGSEAVAQIIEKTLTPLVVGENVFSVEFIWEKMYRATQNIGRKGIVLLGISGIDIALWDIIGKTTQQPCFNLLGGRTRQAVRAYCSAAYAMDDLGELAEIVRKQMQRGYTALKMRFGWGPLDGREGMRRNIALVKRMREVIGPNAELMADAYMGWDLQYALKLLPQLAEFDLTWVEEPLSPDDISGYAYLRSRVNVPISGGEHEMTRWGFRQLIEQRAVDYLQPDVNRVGGITEAKKIWALAQAYDIPVVPHSGDYHNLHLVIAHMNSPLAEHFPDDYLDADTYLSHVIDGQPQLRNGYLHLNDTPGFGVRLKPQFTQPI